ncbi:MAG: cobalamin-dependent protein [Chloroflexota bacterium]
MPQETPADVAALERALLTMDRVAAVRILAGTDHPGSGSVPGLDGASLPPIPLERVDRLLVPVLRSIGNAWGAGRAALSQVYMSARIADEIIGRVEPSARVVRANAPVIGVATLEDRHELGKRIVLLSLRAVGYPVIDYGAGIGVDDLAERADRDGVEVLLVSTLMLRAAIRVEALAARLGEMRVRPRLVVGGAPYLFDAGLWREVGADAMGRSASDAIDLVEAAGPAAGESSVTSAAGVGVDGLTGLLA